MSEKSGQIEAQGDLCQIVLDEIVDISGISAFRSQLLEVLQGDKPVQLIAEKVERIDTAALQVLSAFFQEARSLDKSVGWQNPSEALCYSARLLGLEKIMSLETASV